MINKNTVTIIGRAVKELDLNQLGNDKQKAYGTIAVDRPFTNAEGNRDTDFISVIFWNKTATNAAKLITKGTTVYIEARIHTGKYTNDKGDTVYNTDIVAEHFQIQYVPKVKTDASEDVKAETA